LYVILTNLPRASKFIEAQTKDREVAEAALSRAQSAPQPPEWSEWTPEVAALTDIKDLLLVLRKSVLELAGAKGGDFKPAPRPRTALDELRSEQHERRYQSLVDRVQAAQQRWVAQQQKEG
jgi:hypothetical protein